MAAFTSKATGFWDAEGQTTWNEAGHPQAADTVENQAGDTVTCDSTAACTTLLITDGILDLDTFDLTVSGNFTRAGGAIDTGTGILIVGGDVLHAGGTGNPSITMTGTKNLSWASEAQYINVLTVSGAVTLNGQTNYKKFAGAGSLALGGQAFWLEAMATDWWTFTGTVTGAGTIIFNENVSASNAAVISCGAGNVQIDSTNETYTVGGLVTTGTLYTRGKTNGSCATLSIPTGPLTVGVITLGTTAALNRNGEFLGGSGIANIGGVVMGNDANEGNILGLATMNVFNTGTIDGNSEDTNPMTITANGANLHGGTLLDADVDGPLHCWGVTKSGVVSIDAMDEGSNAGAALGGLHSMIGAAA